MSSPIPEENSAKLIRIWINLANEVIPIETGVTGEGQGHHQGHIGQCHLETAIDQGQGQLKEVIQKVDIQEKSQGHGQPIEVIQEVDTQGKGQCHEKGHRGQGIIEVDQGQKIENPDHQGYPKGHIQENALNKDRLKILNLNISKRKFRKSKTSPMVKANLDLQILMKTERNKRKIKEGHGPSLKTQLRTVMNLLPEVIRRNPNTKSRKSTKDSRMNVLMLTILKVMKTVLKTHSS